MNNRSLQARLVILLKPEGAGTAAAAAPVLSRFSHMISSGLEAHMVSLRTL